MVIKESSGGKSKGGGAKDEVLESKINVGDVICRLREDEVETCTQFYADLVTFEILRPILPKIGLYKFHLNKQSR